MAQFDDADLQNRFGYHPPRDETTKDRHELVRAGLLGIALMLVDNVPPGRELALAITALEEAMMWANAGIARVEPSGKRT
jgi:hypothetical protein